MSKKTKKNSSTRRESGSKNKAGLNNASLIASRVKASLVLDRLERKSLDTVEIESSDSTLASLIIKGSGKVEAFHIIWDEWPTVFSFGQLKADNIEILARGYSELTEEYEEQITVHFVTNNLPATLKFKGMPDSSYHLANFIANEWKRNPDPEDYGEWAPVWKQIRKLSKLDEEKFLDFVRHCRFDYKYSIPEKDDDLDYDQPFYQVEKIRITVFSGSKEKTVFSAEEIQDCLQQDFEELEEDLEVKDQVEEELEEEIEDVVDEVDEEQSVTNEAVQSEMEQSLVEESSSDLKQVAEKQENSDEADSEPTSKEVVDDDESEQDSSESESEEKNTSEVEDTVSLQEDEKPDKEQLEALNRSYDSKFNEVEYVVEEETGSSLDFAPDVKSVKDVRDKKAGNLSVDNFRKIIQLKQRQEGLDQESINALNDAFDWYFNNANELFANEQYEEAEQDYRNALEKLVQIAEPKTEEEKELLENLGEIYIKLDRPDLAVELYENSEELRFSTSIPIPKYVNALLMTGGSYEQKGYLKDAEPMYRKAVEIAGNYLELNDPLVKRANDACLRITKEKTNLISRFSPGELERLKSEDESSKAIMHRKRTIERKKEVTGSKNDDIWITKEELTPIPKPKTPSNLKWWLLSLLPVSLLLFAAVFYLPHLQTSFKQAAETRSSTYSSVDGRMKLTLNDKGVMNYFKDGKTIEGKYLFVGDGPKDFLGLLVGHLRRQSKYLTVEDNTVTFDGIIFYPFEAPEHEMEDYMWRYAKLAQLYRNENGKYPDSVRQFQDAKIQSTYINPFTKQSDQAEITYALGSNSLGLPKMIGSGATWKGQPEARPGLIVCNNFEGSRFFIRGYDRNGKFLSSANQGDCFFIELSYGDNITKEVLEKLERKSEKSVKREKIRYVFVNGDVSMGKYFSIFDAVVPTVLAILAIIPAMLWRHKFKKGQACGREIFLFVVSTSLIVLWYLVAFIDI